ncbi:DHHA1 domain-containing protein [Eubacteriales bacterium OttesenSCG-928-K08]|nr:DHHA1 domain-containing protein [Eubacteriales bacterium OttesenSCG-928-K08]
MTKKLYLDDSYLTQIEAVVTACAAFEDNYAVELNETVFYPTGGGQPHDTGFLGDIPVIDVREENERVLHITQKPLNVGDIVTAKIDWPRRLDHMRQHAGEHLLSFAAKELFGAINVGFHMAATYCTIDIDIPLDASQVKTLEERTNELILENLPVFIRYAQPDELDDIPLRKRAAGLEGIIRIVYMPGGDSCTCCGTHVKNTGEIGSILITAADHYKGGERLTFVCGKRANAHSRSIQNIVSELARSYSCQAGDLIAAIQKQQQQMAALKRENGILNAKLNAYIMEELSENARQAGRVRLIVKQLDTAASQLRPLALALCKQPSVFSLLLASEGENVNYVLCRSENLKHDMGEFAPIVNAALNARGGGRQALAQGSAKLTGGINEALKQLEDYFEKRLMAEK